MSLTTWFNWSTTPAQNGELPDLFPLSIKESDFVKTDTLNIFMKILTDVVERTQGVSDDLLPLLWDNCVASESSDGLVTMLSRALSQKEELFLVYDKALKLLRKATSVESAQIKADYKAKGESSTGVFVSFKNYVRADMIKLYSGLEYCTVLSLNKSMNLSKAIQFKISDLRASVALLDAEGAKTQAAVIAKSLSDGKDVLMDAKDIVETAEPKLEAIKEAMLFLDKKRSFYLGMPSSYITGESSTKGLGDTGEGDAKAVERGLKNYYFAVIKPVLEAIFSIKTEYKSQDFRQVSSALEAMKTFSLVGTELVSLENQTFIVNKLLDLDEDEKGDKQPEIEPPVDTKGAPVKVPAKQADANA